MGTGFGVQETLCGECMNQRARGSRQGLRPSKQRGKSSPELYIDYSDLFPIHILHTPKNVAINVHRIHVKYHLQSTLYIEYSVPATAPARNILIVGCCDCGSSTCLALCAQIARQRLYNQSRTTLALFHVGCTVGPYAYRRPDYNHISTTRKNT